MSRSKRRQRRHVAIRRRTPPGSSPGTVVADPQAPKPVIEVIAYGPDNILERELANAADVRSLVGKHPVVWINVEGLGDADTITKLGELFGIHKLVLEDVVNVHQRAKVEEYDGGLFIVARMAALADHVETEQVSLFVGQNFVLTFQEGRPGDNFDPVRERLRQSKGQIRLSGPDYLAYALLDAVVDGYYPLLEQFGERLEAVEDTVLDQLHNHTIDRIHELKNDLLILRRAIWPHREALAALARGDTPLITKSTRVFLRDCYDHVVQIVDLVEAYREQAADLRDLYMTMLSNRTNDVMRVLTIIATLFIPLSFIAGLYGMNFDTNVSPLNMPELHWFWGYPFALSLMVSVAVGMLLFFRRRGWIGSGRSR